MNVGWMESQLGTVYTVANTYRGKKNNCSSMTPDF